MNSSEGYVKVIVKCQTGYGSDSVLLENRMVMKNEFFGKTKEELENVIVDVAMELFCLDANLFFLSVDWDSISVKHADDDGFEHTSSNSFVSLCRSSSNLSSILAVKFTLVCESVALDHSFRISLFREFLWLSISSQDKFNSVLKSFDDSFGVDNKDLCQKFLDDSTLRFDHYSFGDARVFNWKSRGRGEFVVNDHPPVTLSVMAIGDSKSGKSSLLNWLMSGKKEYVCPIKDTINFSIHSFSFNNLKKEDISNIHDSIILEPLWKKETAKIFDKDEVTICKEKLKNNTHFSFDNPALRFMQFIDTPTFENGSFPNIENVDVILLLVPASRALGKKFLPWSERYISNLTKSSKVVVVLSLFDEYLRNNSKIHNSSHEKEYSTVRDVMRSIFDFQILLPKTVTVVPFQCVDRISTNYFFSDHFLWRKLREIDASINRRSIPRELSVKNSRKDDIPCILFVGATGGGKTTVIKHLLGIMNKEKGGLEGIFSESTKEGKAYDFGKGKAILVDSIGFEIIRESPLSLETVLSETLMKWKINCIVIVFNGSSNYDDSIVKKFRQMISKMKKVVFCVTHADQFTNSKREEWKKVLSDMSDDRILNRITKEIVFFSPLCCESEFDRPLPFVSCPSFLFKKNNKDEHEMFYSKRTTEKDGKEVEKMSVFCRDCFYHFSPCIKCDLGEASVVFEKKEEKFVCETCKCEWKLEKTQSPIQKAISSYLDSLF